MPSRLAPGLSLDLPSPTSFMADAGNLSARRDSAAVNASGRSSSSPLHRRPLPRAATAGSNYGEATGPAAGAGAGPGPGKRRDSLIAESLRSSTDDLLIPRVNTTGMGMDHEPSHWQSAPLGLALLPAVGGLFFKDGSAVITDITLLLLAAVFLNWSVRLPWDWYCSAQQIQLHDPHMPSDYFPENDTIEEESENEGDGHAKASASDNKGRTQRQRPRRSSEVEQAQSELRSHELVALLSCFVFPMIGAWLLHAIRGQLSRPSEGLVSNYNLTIFLLAAEIRPLSHLLKMVQSRTLHLQRMATSNPFEGDRIDNDKLVDLSKRVDEIETHVVQKTSSKTGSASSPTTIQVSAEVRKQLQPELDALNRAVRRYEKRTTLLTMQTEARLQDLESRMADAITLAAAAERGAAAKKRGSASVLFDWVCALVVLPLQATWTMVIIPPRVATKAVEMLEGYFGQKVRTELRTAGKMPKTGGSRPAGRGSKKAM